MQYRFEDPLYQDLIKKIFIERPLSRLNGPKLTFIMSMIKEHKLKNILEIGTYAGGTAYLLSKEFPDCQITTIDLNNFEEYFKKWDHDRFLISDQQRYPEVYIDVNSIIYIQEIYKSLSPNAKFIVGNLTSIDISSCDAIIIDGDHNTRALLSDLEYCYNNMKPGVIFVDDCVYPHLKKTCEDFCASKNIKCTFEVYKNYKTASGYDLCVIRKF